MEKKMQEIAMRAAIYLGLTRQINIMVVKNTQKFLSLENAMESEQDLIYVNEDWLRMIFQTENVTELRRMLYHEFRHQYQFDQVARSQNSDTTLETIETVKSWENEMYDNIRNDNSEKTVDYYLQNVELDAEAFALHLLDLDAESGIKVTLNHQVPKKAVEPIKKRKKEIAEFYERLN